MGRNIVRGFLSIFGSRLGRVILGIGSTPIIVRILGSSDYGDYGVVLSVLSLVWIFVNAGIFDGIRKYIAESRDDPDWQADVFVFYLRLALVTAAVAALLVVGLTFGNVVQAVFGEPFEAYFYLLAGIIVVRQFWMVARATLMGLGYEQYSESIRLLRFVLLLGIGVPLAFVGFGVTGLLIGRLVGAGLVALGAYVLVFRKISPTAITSPLPSGFPRRELLSFNVMSIVLTFLMVSLYHTDVLLLKLFKGSTVTGYYKAALVIAEFVWFAPVALQMVLLHSTSELWSKNDDEQITRLASRATRYSLLLTLLLAIGLAALAHAFVPLYLGEEFRPAITPLLLLLPGTVGFSVARPIFAIGQGEGSIGILVRATVVSTVLNLVLNLVLIPQYGMVGAAVATSVGYGSMLLLHVWSARTIGFDPLNDLRFARVAITALSSGAFIFLLARAIGSPLVALVFVPPLGFLCYSAVAITVGAIDYGELDEIADHLPVSDLPFVSPD